MQVKFSRNGSDHAGATDGYTNPSAGQKPGYQLTHDPIFYLMVGFFAFLTTALPGVMGQPNFLPIVQALGLTVFVAIPLRRGERHYALAVLALWLGVQAITLLVMALGLPTQTARAIPDGFTYRTELVTWAYSGDLLPRSLAAAPWNRALEVLGVLLGTLFTGGLVGSWILVRGVDLFAFGAATLIGNVSPGGIVMALMPWRLLTLAGYAGFLLLLAQPIVINRWNPSHYLTDQRRLLLWSAGLLITGLLLESLLPGIWQRILTPG